MLLRSGRTVTILFYGGQGGGKKHKASTLEIGYMMKIELSHSRSTAQMQRAKEWLPIWSHEHIRNNFKSYSLLCLFVEIMGAIAPEEDVHDQNSDFDDTMEGLFRVLSNAVVHLEGRTKEKKCDPYSELLVFLGKLLIEQGVFPIRDNCAFCDEVLSKLSKIYLITDHGGFACGECADHLEEAITSSSREGRELWELLGSVANHRYQELTELRLENRDVIHTLLNYFYYQFHFKESDFRSLKMVL